MQVIGLLVLVCAFAAAHAGSYTDKYDNINIDQILANKRVLNNYIRCLMDEGSCTPEGRELKKTLPDALETGCDKCSQKQRDVSQKVFKHLINNNGKDFVRMVKKFDPKGNYKKRYELEAQKYKDSDPETYAKLEELLKTT